MKKRIFIAMHYMEIGGAEISLIGLLSAFDYTKYDVDLFISSHQGELMSLIPKEVNILPEISAYAALRKPMSTIIKQGHFAIAFARCFARYRNRNYLRKNKTPNDISIFQYVAQATTPLLPSLYDLGEYDLAISFLAPHNIVKDKIKAKKKIAWIHTDYAYVNINVALELPAWDSFDYIASISTSTGNNFCKVFPSLKNKIIQIENILSSQFVNARSKSPEGFLGDMPSVSGEYRFLSVGRYSHPKNFDNVPFIASRLKELGLAFKWYIIGYGGQEKLIKSKIQETGMEEYVILLGKKTNPYPYMAQCDFYIQPSRYEGQSVAVREAQILCKPVIITNYPTAPSQIKNGIDGCIVPLENEECAKEIFSFTQNTELQRNIVHYLINADYTNVNEIKIIDQII